ncbi:hypothetical protein CO641_02205 [Lysobacteraceae bacterium NML91-0213]|nr:hypothetical protein CO641_02205 [Xanthomonadaceae bacterium NML91-0213]
MIRRACAALRRALRPAPADESLHLLGDGLDALIMKTDASLQAVDPLDRLIRYANAAAEHPPEFRHASSADCRMQVGRMLRSCWQSGRYPDMRGYRRSVLAIERTSRLAARPAVTAPRRSTVA